MQARHSGSVEFTPVTSEGAVGCRMRELLTAADGAPTFAMRQFEVAPGGNTPFHEHPWEHEVFVLSGEGGVRSAGGPRRIAAGDAVLVPPGEAHSFVSSGDHPLVFLCMIPVAQSCCR